MNFFHKIMSRFQRRDGIFFIEMEKLLGFPPKEIRYYEEAFTLGSNRSQDLGHPISYERLEFLGDAILGAVIAHFVFLQAPNKDEGDLTKMRTRMVRRDNLNQIGEELQLREYLQTERKSLLLSGNISGNLLEALVGAIYLDRGYQKATEFIHRILIDANLSMKDLENKVISYKSLMVEWAQKYHKTIAFIAEEDPTYKGKIKYFQARVMINDKVYTKAHDTSKKKAEERAAKRAYFRALDRRKDSKKKKQKNKEE
ncbi:MULTISPECIES: ribonuclease III domain-containing protein [unclassified Capnocytophaga]|jgi:ribonuclease III|uniref:ribonuclease III domain-containing protein n=1 Tax=unclassified Capnocytophaga TaxID=2640652 RepID=UPI000202B2C7|nr:ribonuclease III domain-containing protein [Capnocytophaga sp. G2]EGD35172.1 ribonuclease 3 [Capnocytophaga sp. oral taxon 338 str. F0234]MEB3003792.1 ribonuclease III domain-containing protein [Capnocytophaga sp. G2]